MKRILSQWGDPLFWLFCHVAGIIVPVVVIVIVLAAMTLSFYLGAITNGGQFALYSIAMLATTLYILFKDSNFRLPFSRWLGLAFFSVLFLAAVFFILAVLAQSGVKIAYWITEWPTIGLFCVSLIVAFLAVAADKRRESDRKRFEDMKVTKQSDLQEKFKKKYMGGGEK